MFREDYKYWIEKGTELLTAAELVKATDINSLYESSMTDAEEIDDQARALAQRFGMLAGFGVACGWDYEFFGEF